jgi:outer membrane cobalamin receptor
MEFYNMQLDQLMNLNVSVASTLPMTSRESPGVVTVITQDEIRKSGAADLMEVLKQVPGFTFGVDVEGVLGAGIRGNWANEGKVLMLWDGIETNEDLYSTIQFGARYPIDQIKRIEIIRGPGSAMYGGNAEYAVINVVTINSPEFNGVDAALNYSVLSKTFGSRGVSVATGKSIGMSHLNVSAYINQANRSQETFTDIKGNSYDMTDQSALMTMHYRVDYNFKGLSVSGLYDGYEVEQRDGYDEIYLRSYKTSFNNTYINAKYEFQKGNKLELTPGIRFKFQRPWSYTESVTDDSFSPFDTHVNKKEFYLNSNYNPSEKVNFTGGLSYYHVLAYQKIDSLYFSNGENKLNIDNYSAFVQSIAKLNWFNVTLGVRYDYNPYYGSSVVPRIGLTRVWEKFHVKTLYNSAFRTPSIENINANPDITPERTRTLEVEGGFLVTPQSYLTINFYEINTSDPVIYYYDENDNDLFINASSIGTRGFEAEYKWKTNRFYAAVNYSFYAPTDKSKVEIYHVPDHEDKHTSFASHMVNLNGGIEIAKNVYLNPLASFNSTRYSVILNDDGTAEAVKHLPVYYFNLSLNFDHVFTEELSVQASIINLTDEENIYIQPYNGNHRPLPGTGREYRLKIAYLLPFKNK